MNLKLGLNYSSGKAVWLAPNGQIYEGNTEYDEHAYLAYELCFKFYKKDIPKRYTPHIFIEILLNHNWIRVSWFSTEIYLEIENFNISKDAIIEYLSTQKGKSLYIEDWFMNKPRAIYKGTVDKFLDEELEKIINLKFSTKSTPLNFYDMRINPNTGDVIYYNDKHQVSRLDGPAKEYSNGTKYWYVNGKRHRLDGPAIEWNNGDKEWYLAG